MTNRTFGHRVRHASSTGGASIDADSDESANVIVPVVCSGAGAGSSGAFSRREDDVEPLHQARPGLCQGHATPMSNKQLRA